MCTPKFYREFLCRIFFLNGRVHLKKAISRTVDHFEKIHFLNILLLQKSFRRQHDQLRLVINRVLRPAISQEPIIVDDTNGNGNLASLVLQTAQSGLDVADANAIEVNNNNYK